MTQEEKESLLSLLSKLNDDGLLNIYDDEDSHYEIDWMFFDSELCVKIKR